MALFRCQYQVIPYDEVGAEIALDLWWAKIFICLYCIFTGQTTTAVTIVQLLVPMALLFPGTATTMR